MSSGSNSSVHACASAEQLRHSWNSEQDWGLPAGAIAHDVCKAGTPWARNSCSRAHTSGRYHLVCFDALNHMLGLTNFER